MQRRTGLPAILLLLALSSLGLVACGGDDKKSDSGGGKSGGSATFLMGTAPDFLDPAIGYTTQSAQATFVTYTPLLTYRHEAGKPGTELIPGLAKALPVVAADQKTYTLTLRDGLVYSDGKPVKASDFKSSIQRSIKLNWGGKSFFTNYIAGAEDYDTGKASSISGITANDSTGEIVIKLSTAYGAFANVLAFPSAAVLPSGTPVKNLSNDPPPGVGAYMITDVVPNQSWVMKKNPKFAGLNIPDIPVGSLDTINVKVSSNIQSNGQQVLNNDADVFDPGDNLPPALISDIESEAKDRFSRETNPSTFYFFLNTTKAPFNNQKAREAVNWAIDRQALSRLASGFMKPACFFLPEGIVGHSDGPCIHGNLDKPDLAKAKALIKESGTAGTKVTVFGQQRTPRKQFAEYYADVLKSLGYDVTVRILADATYYPTIGNAETNPQTGTANWFQDFPNPSNFFLLMDAESIQPVNNQNFSLVNDDFIQKELADLNPIPATELDSVADRWQALDAHQAEKAYVAVYGSQQSPKFFSDKLDFKAAVFHPLFQNDWSTIALKSN